MKRKITRFLLCTLLSSLLLSVSALADTGPKPQLIVRVEHAPQELYYLDLLAEGEYDGSDGYNGIEWSYSDEEAAALDEDLLAQLRAAVPDGWHACTAEGATGAPMWGQLYAEKTDRAGNALHSFGYFGVPDTYRIIIVTKSGETWISDTLERKVLQSSATVDWESGTAGAGDTTVSTPPVWLGYVLQFLATLLPTLVIEGLLLLAFGFSWKENRKLFLLVNFVTQGGLALYLAATVLRHGVSGWSYLIFIPIELVILLTETLIYRRALAGQSRSRAALYGVCANLASALIGLFLAEPVWRFVVSIS